jgi:hypothetical protein
MHVLGQPLQNFPKIGIYIYLSLTQRLKDGCQCQEGLWPEQVAIF